MGYQQTHAVLGALSIENIPPTLWASGGLEVVSIRSLTRSPRPSLFFRKSFCCLGSFQNPLRNSGCSQYETNDPNHAITIIRQQLKALSTTQDGLCYTSNGFHYSMSKTNERNRPPPPPPLPTPLPILSPGLRSGGTGATVLTDLSIISWRGMSW